MTLIKSMVQVARTREIGDSRVFVAPVGQRCKVRTGEVDVALRSLMCTP